MSIGFDDRIVVWDLVAFDIMAELERPFEGRKLDPTMVKLSADGSALVLATGSEKVQVRDGRRLTVRASHDLKQWVHAVAVSADGSRIAFNMDDDGAPDLSSFGIAEAATGRVLGRMTRPKEPWHYEVAFADLGSRIVTSDTDGGLKMIDIAAGRIVWENPPSPAGYIRFEVHAPSRQIMTTIGGRYAFLDPETGGELHHVELKRDAAPGPVPDAKLLVAEGNAPLIANRNTGEVVRRFDGAIDAAPTFGFLRQGRGLVFTRGKGAPVLLDIESGRTSHPLGSEPPDAILTSADGARLLLQDGARVRLVDASTFEVLSEVTLATELGERPFLAQHSADLAWIVLEGESRRREVWELPSGRRVHAGATPDRAPSSVAVSSTLRLIVTRPDWETVDIYSVDEQRSVARIQATEEFTSIYDVAVSPDGRTLAYRLDNEIHFYDLAARRNVAQSGKVEPATLIYLPKGTRLFFGKFLLEAQSGRVVRSLPDGMSGLVVAFSPDERLMVLTKDHSVQVWDLEGQHQIAALAVFHDDEWAIVASDGYTASPGAQRHLFLEVGTELRPVDERFRATYFREALPLE